MSADARATVEAAARAGGAAIRAALNASGGPLRVQAKDRGGIDMLTEVDLAAEAAVRAVLDEYAPGVPILAEEGGGDRGPTRFIVDPLDGTTNFVHGFPAFATSVGLQVDGVLVAGCVYDAVAGLAYSAHRGGGATCEGRPLRVSAVTDLGQALALTGFAYDRRQRADFYLRFVKAALENCHGLRRMGAAALDFCHIAAGRADVYWEFNLSPWDVAAGLLLVEEAGGRVSTLGGGPVDLDRPQILCSNGHVHDAMAALLRPLLSSTSD